MDSTPQVTSFQHRAEVDFLRQVMSTMKMSSSKVAMAQFTPWSRVEWSLSNATYPESRVQEAPYCPCELENCPSTSINSLTRSTMSSANRKGVPDVILVISNSYQPLVEVLPNEPLISPSSPLHVFYIVIGSNMHVSRFEPSAHTVGIKVTDFEHLPHLVGPLCQSVNGYIKALWMSKIIADVSWWNFLNWNSTSCHRQNAEQTVFWTVPCTSTTRFGPLCWIIIGVILLFALILVALLLYAIYNYNEENRRLRHRISESERLLRKQNEYFTSQLHSEMQKQIANGEKHAEEMKKQQDMMQSQFDRQLDMAYQQGSKIQILPPFIQPPPPHHEHHSGKERNGVILDPEILKFQVKEAIEETPVLNPQEAQEK
ncbi:hypothetical protein B9Z55_019811 [Caenorhabditis nigoni]|uniref:Uncharacterized protein n=1 Tax=Caenorhabditis nigoni TaxID=1611254 RepID=A0A2G5TJY5_9PELO|nr:hypothetical protein B9Z55_019811 [Caenorhabditis nigoni]